MYQSSGEARGEGVNAVRRKGPLLTEVRDSTGAVTCTRPKSQACCPGASVRPSRLKDSCLSSEIRRGKAGINTHRQSAGQFMRLRKQMVGTTLGIYKYYQRHQILGMRKVLNRTRAPQNCCPWTRAIIRVTDPGRSNLEHPPAHTLTKAG